LSRHNNAQIPAQIPYQQELKPLDINYLSRHNNAPTGGVLVAGKKKPKKPKKDKSKKTKKDKFRKDKKK